MRLIRGFMSFEVFGIWCSQKCCIGPAINKKLPWWSRISIWSTSFRNLCLMRKGRVSPKLTDPITGLMPYSLSWSLCQETLSCPVRYKFSNTLVKWMPVSFSIFSLMVSSLEWLGFWFRRRDAFHTRQSAVASDGFCHVWWWAPVSRVFHPLMTDNNGPNLRGWRNVHRA